MAHRCLVHCHDQRVGGPFSYAYVRVWSARIEINGVAGAQRTVMFTMVKIEFAIEDEGVDDAPTDDFRFAAAVAEFGLLHRDSPSKGSATWDDTPPWPSRAGGPTARATAASSSTSSARPARSLAVEPMRGSPSRVRR